MQSLIHPEFGEMRIERTKRSMSVRVKVGLDGAMVILAPQRLPLFIIKRIIMSSNMNLTKLAAAQPNIVYEDGCMIGKSHKIAVVQTTMVTTPTIALHKQTIVVQLPPPHTIHDKIIQQQLKPFVKRALHAEAKAYLPRRLAYIAQQHGFSYVTVRFPHTSTRWGSCSTQGTISLNIALMKLPHELIDYVLIHELAHTREMNHSPDFWRHVAAIDPLYKLHKKSLKSYSPNI